MIGVDVDMKGGQLVVVGTEVGLSTSLGDLWVEQYPYTIMGLLWTSFEHILDAAALRKGLRGWWGQDACNWRLLEPLNAHEKAKNRVRSNKSNETYH